MAKTEVELRLAMVNLGMRCLITVVCLLAIGCGGGGDETDKFEQARIASLKEEIAEMESKKGEAEAARKTLDKLVVSDAKLDRNKLRISFIVRNGLAEPLSRVVISYKTVTPGRSVPWDTKSGGYKIPGGLEPDESRKIELSYIGHTPEDQEIVVVAEIARAEDASGEVIADATVFDPKRLKKFKAALADATKGD